MRRLRAKPAAGRVLPALLLLLLPCAHAFHTAEGCHTLGASVAVCAAGSGAAAAVPVASPNYWAREVVYSRQRLTQEAVAAQYPMRYFAKDNASALIFDRCPTKGTCAGNNSCAAGHVSAQQQPPLPCLSLCSTAPADCSPLPFAAE